MYPFLTEVAAIVEFETYWVRQGQIRLMPMNNARISVHQRMATTGRQLDHETFTGFCLMQFVSMVDEVTVNVGPNRVFCVGNIGHIWPDVGLFHRQMSSSPHSACDDYLTILYGLTHPGVLLFRMTAKTVSLRVGVTFVVARFIGKLPVSDR